MLKFIFLFANLTFGHGENKYGPHMGYIQMPATFHTELVEEKNGNYRVYLLDLQNNNPEIQNSRVDLSYSYNQKQTKFECIPQNDFFLCTNKDKLGINKNVGEIRVLATRLGIKANPAIYPLPLRLKSAQNSDPHSMHKM